MHGVRPGPARLKRRGRFLQIRSRILICKRSGRSQARSGRPIFDKHVHRKSGRLGRYPRASPRALSARQSSSFGRGTRSTSSRSSTITRSGSPSPGTVTVIGAWPRRAGNDLLMPDLVLDSLISRTYVPGWSTHSSAWPRSSNGRPTRPAFSGWFERSQAFPSCFSNCGGTNDSATSSSRAPLAR